MSLYKRLHEVQGGGGPAGSRRRDPVLDELRQKIHHHLIDELGPILYDKRLSKKTCAGGCTSSCTPRSHKSAPRCPRPTRPSSSKTSPTTSSATGRSTGC